MSITFSADEIFEIAEHIEQQAAGFYKKAAEKTKDKESKNMFLEFSAMVADHAETFGKMRQGLSQADLTPATFDPDGEVVLYLKSFAEAHGWEGKGGQKEEFTGTETPEQILNSALTAEKDSVAFYVGIKDMVAKESGKNQVENIIKQEMQHIALINGKLIALKKN